MSLFALTLSYIKRRKLTTLLNVLLLALGIATIVVLLLFSRQIEHNLSKNAEGIDLVVGAKGSPLQVILSSIYHVDVPTGNIPVDEAEEIMRNPMVTTAIPLALGDSYRGHRIVGTTHEYAAHYNAEPAEGRLWEAPMEVTLGDDVAREQNLAVGDELISAHGLGGGDAHGDHPMRVVGILDDTDTVIDRLILTSVETIWTIHGQSEAAPVAGIPTGAHDDEHPDEDPQDEGVQDETAQGVDPQDEAVDSVAVPPLEATPVDSLIPDTAAPSPEATPADSLVPDTAEASPVPSGPPPGFPPSAGGPPGAASNQPERQYTALLVQYGSPVAAAMLPRYINSQTNLQAASPAFETARLLSLLDVGVDAFRVFAFILILGAALGVFIALYNALKQRRYDLAMMRTLGASRNRLLMLILLEGILLTVLGTFLGLILGHVAAEWMGSTGQAQGMGLTGWGFAPAELLLIVGSVALGAVCALIPALQAYSTDISKTLAKG